MADSIFNQEVSTEISKIAECIQNAGQLPLEDAIRELKKAKEIMESSKFKIYDVDYLSELLSFKILSSIISGITSRNNKNIKHGEDEIAEIIAAINRFCDLYHKELKKFDVNGEKCIEKLPKFYFMELERVINASKEGFQRKLLNEYSSVKEKLSRYASFLDFFLFSDLSERLEEEYDKEFYSNMMTHFIESFAGGKFIVDSLRGIDLIKEDYKMVSKNFHRWPESFCQVANVPADEFFYTNLIHFVDRLKTSNGMKEIIEGYKEEIAKEGQDFLFERLEEAWQQGNAEKITSYINGFIRFTKKFSNYLDESPEEAFEAVKKLICW
ncbi:MAG: hypothetical protein QW199_03300 [Candidatus Pacearchaeota archaeon]